MADFFTKTLQGSKLKWFKRVIMGCDDVEMLWDDSNDKDKVS